MKKKKPAGVCDNDLISTPHLKCDLSKTPSAFDVESEDWESHVQFVLNGLFTSVEFLSLVDVLTTCFTPVYQKRY